MPKPPRTPSTTPAEPAISVSHTVMRAPSANWSAAGPIGSGADESGIARPQRKISSPIIAPNMVQPGFRFVQFIVLQPTVYLQVMSESKYFLEIVAKVPSLISAAIVALIWSMNSLLFLRMISETRSTNT